MIKRERCGMNRRVSILFIFMLFFQVVSSGFLPLQAKAEGLEKGIFTKVTITDEEGNEIEEGNESEASVEIHVDWSVSGLDVEPGHTESLTLPTEWQIEDDQEDSIMIEDAEVGQYEAHTDGRSEERRVGKEYRIERGTGRQRANR